MLGHGALGRFALGQTSSFPPVVSAEVGAFTFSGQATTGDQVRIGGTGAFVLTGQDASRIVSVRADVGAFVLTGQTTLGKRGLRLVASATPSVNPIDQPMFSAIGALAIGQSGTLDQQATTFLWAGIDAFGAKSIGLGADTGAFVWTGYDATLIGSFYPSKIRIFPRVGRGLRVKGQGGGMVARTSSGTSVRARAFGG